MPLVEEPDLVSHWDYCYERSLGCVGILKNWFQNALFDAMTEGANTVKIQHLERRALSVAQCRNILKKIKEGENNHAQIEAEVSQLRAELGLPSLGAVADEKEEKTLKTPQLGTPKARLRRKPGQPKPKRHQVGNQ